MTITVRGINWVSKRTKKKASLPLNSKRAKTYPAIVPTISTRMIVERVMSVLLA